MACSGCGQRYTPPPQQPGGAPVPEMVIMQESLPPPDIPLDTPGRAGPRTGYNVTPYAPIGGGPGVPEEALSKKDE